MKFKVVEIKKLTPVSPNVSYSLSLRLESAIASPDPANIKHTIHAVVPWDIAGIQSPRIGDPFDFAVCQSDRTSSSWCTDSACSLMSFRSHEFGKGCRLYDEDKSRKDAFKNKA